MGNNLFSLGGLIDYLPSASPRAITIKPPWPHRLFPNKQLLPSGYSYIQFKLCILGHGQGQALVQLDYSYGVDYEPLLDVPPTPAFDFTVDARYSGSNNSHIDITTCQR